MFASRPLLCLGGEVRNIFSYHLYTCKNHFIHSLGSSLVQWMMVRIIGKEEPKPDLQVRLGRASLRLGGEVHLGGALLRLGRPEKYINLVSGPPRRKRLLLCGALRLGVHSYVYAELYT